MKLFKAIHKTKNKQFEVKKLENGNYEMEGKEVNKAIIHRWYTLIEKPQGEAVTTYTECTECNGIDDECQTCNGTGWIEGKKFTRTIKKKKYRKLSEKDVLEIRKKHEDGEKMAHLAKKYESAYSTIWCICKNWTWKKVV